MTTTAVNDVLRERLVDAREAAHCLNLQLYLLTHPKERDRLQVPHYRVGKLVRFKLGELMVWMPVIEASASAASSMAATWPYDVRPDAASSPRDRRTNVP